MCHYAFAIVKDHDDAEDIVQAVFVDFWKKIQTTKIESAYENYLIRAVKFKCIDFHRSTLVKRKYEEAAQHEMLVEDEPVSENHELKDLVQLSISQLPEKTREVFILSKQEGMSYKEISEKLNISPKTVENQMGRAFKHLREKLKNYKELLILLFLWWLG